MRRGPIAFKVLMIFGLRLHVHAFGLHIHHHVKGPAIGYLGVALGAFASWVGVPGPGEPLLIAAGVLAAKNKLDIASVITVAWAAATAGGIAGWLLGVKAGRKVLITRGPFHAARQRALARGEQVFDRYPVIAILVTPSWIAGIHGVRPVIYQAVNALSAVAWAVGIGLAAYYVGPAVIDVANDLGWITPVGVGTLIAIIVSAEIVRRRHRARTP